MEQNRGWVHVVAHIICFSKFSHNRAEHINFVMFQILGALIHARLNGSRSDIQCRYWYLKIEASRKVITFFFFNMMYVHAKGHAFEVLIRSNHLLIPHLPSHTNSVYFSAFQSTV